MARSVGRGMREFRAALSSDHRDEDDDDDDEDDRR
jgi:Sec-independent protein translocase protein TatA